MFIWSDRMEKNKNMSREILEWLVMIAIAILLAFIIKTYIFSTTIVKGVSMQPTLETNDKLFVNRVSFMIKDLEPGDIVEFHNPNNEKEDFIKRVIALEGDTVEIIDNRVYVNNERLNENYTSSGGETIVYNDDSWTIGKDQVFVLGDNRPKSNDSRAFGPIPKDSIVGIAFFRFLPIGKFGKL